MPFRFNKRMQATRTRSKTGTANRVITTVMPCGRGANTIGLFIAYLMAK